MKNIKDALDELEELIFNDVPALRYKARARSARIRGNLPIIEPNTSSDKFKGFGQSKDSPETPPKNDSERARLSHFTLTLPASSTIQTASYWPKKQLLQVSFKSGSTYQYEDVPLITVKFWMAASSAGSWFYYNIRTSYEYRKI